MVMPHLENSMADIKAKLLQFLKDWLAWAEAKGVTEHDDTFSRVGLCGAWSNYAIDNYEVTCDLFGALGEELRKDFGQSVDPFKWYSDGKPGAPYDWKPRVKWVRKKIKELSA